MKRDSSLPQIALISFGILALELALIRWMSCQVRLFAYLNNLVLIGCFLGMGLGMALGRRKPGLFHWTLPGLCALCLPLAFSGALGWMQIRFPDPSIHLWGAEMVPSSTIEFIYALFVVLFLFAGLVLVFLFAGSGLGRLMAGGGIKPYSANLAGSLAGVLAITLATAFNATPAIWFLLACLPFLWFSRAIFSMFSLAGILFLVHASNGGAIFSPYNRIDLEQSGWGGIAISVNRDFHQYIHDFSGTERLELNQPKAIFKKMYDIPFLIALNRKNALIMGAGTGNDVQAALRNGFEKITAVEIDPQILEVGKKLHPEQPYENPRVTAVIADARSFLGQYHGPPFDVVCYGLVDSHAMFSAYSMLRLDNFLYTEEGLKAAWSHVAPHGVMTINFSVAGGPWIAQRLYQTVYKATRTEPLVCNHQLHYALTYIVSREPNLLPLDKLQPFPMVQPKEIPRKGIMTTTDNWPFLYLRPGVFPWGYLSVLGGILLMALGGIRISYGSALGTPFHWSLFFMGAAFMLLETRGITSLSILFGSTWVVNAAVISGILALGLVANSWVERRPTISFPIVFGLLLLSLALLWIINLAWLGGLPQASRWVAGSLLVTLPIGFAGVMVAMFLVRTDNLAAALASNLLGSVVGGCLEYLSIYLGLRMLVLLAFGLYILAWISCRKSPF